MRSVLFFAVLPIIPVPTMAATLTSVPMDGGMIHANILYRAAEHRLEAHVESTVPQLAPLDVTYPADNFSPADGWFPFLDPSEQGLAFSRQYGFVVDAASDPIPTDMGIWIRHLDHTPGLSFFKYQKNSRSWEPMFGTEGSTNLFQWSLLMFHPGIACPPTNGMHSAVFEAFAVNPTTGQQRSDIAPAQFTLQWTNIPSVRVLHLTASHVLCWNAAATNYVLETAWQFSSGWSVVTNRAEIADGQCRLPVDCGPAKGLYRLRRVP